MHIYNIIKLHHKWLKCTQINNKLVRIATRAPCLPLVKGHMLDDRRTPSLLPQPATGRSSLCCSLGKLPPPPTLPPTPQWLLPGQVGLAGACLLLGWACAAHCPHRVLSRPAQGAPLHY